MTPAEANEWIMGTKSSTNERPNCRLSILSHVVEACFHGKRRVCGRMPASASKASTADRLRTGLRIASPATLSSPKPAKAGYCKLVDTVRANTPVELFAMATGPAAKGLRTISEDAATIPQRAR